MGIADRIKAWRNALGLTQAEFARRAGMSKSSLVGYEVGQRKPGADALAALATTGVNMTWLLTGEGEMLAQTRAESTFSAIPHGRRWEKIIALVEGIEDEAKRAALLDELFSLAQRESKLDATQKELEQLRQAVAALQKKTA